MTAAIKKLPANGRNSSAASDGDNSLSRMLLITDQQHDWHEEHVELIKEAQQTTWHGLLELSLYVHDFDPYAIFKAVEDTPLGGSDGTTWRANKVTKNYSLRGREDLRMQRTCEDNSGKKSTRFLRAFSIYFSIKTIIASIAFFFVLKYEQSMEKSSESLSKRLAVFSETILQAIGNPYSSYKDIALVLYLCPGCFCTLCLVILRSYYKRHPMDIASLRFILDPRFELKRIDASICYRLASIKSSLQVYKSQQAQQFKGLIMKRSSSGRNDDWPAHPMEHLFLNGEEQRRLAVKSAASELELRERKYCEKIELYLSEFSANFYELKSFRPITFAPAYYVAIVRRAQLLVWGWFANYTGCWVVLAFSLIFSAYSSRCPSLNCNPLTETFSLPELLALVEWNFITLIEILSSSLNMFLFSLLTINQLDLIKSAKAELRTCKQNIQKFTASGVVAITISGSSGQRRRAHDDNNVCAMRSPRDRLERAMLKSLIRLIVFSKEMRDNSRCMSEQVMLPFFYIGGGLLLALINLQLKISDSNSLRWFIIVFIWATFNSCAIACASVYARLLEIERSAWSVLAESSKLFKFNYCEYDLISTDMFHVQGPRANTQTKRTRRVCGKHGTFVADLWLKFVHSTSSNVEQHCSRIFNIELNYQTIIEANFFIIFIVSLTLSHDR